MTPDNILKQSPVGTPRGVSITRDVKDLPPQLAGLNTPLRRRDGIVDLVVLSQQTKNGTEAVFSVPDVLGIHGETQIGLSRQNRIMQQTADGRSRSGRCSLCADIPASPSSGANRPAFEVDNIRPFGPLIHKVVGSRRHLTEIKDVTVDEVLDCVELFYECAVSGRATIGRLDGLTIGMNFGEYPSSGASQPHFHYQIAGMGPANYNAADRLGVLCRAYRRLYAGADYLDDYAHALAASGLVVIEHPLAIAYVPISQRFKAEVQIMLSRTGAGNILDTTADERHALAGLQLDVMNRLERLGYVALNQVWYSTRFSTMNDCGQRLIISVFPRSSKSIVAFYELSGNQVIDTLPWDSAQLVRES
jgi:diadenosine tetraphosphate (Ap4A) HIT family hydrolase